MFALATVPGARAGGLYLYEIGSPDVGLTYLSEADLDFSDRVEFSGLGPGLKAALGSRGLLDAKLDIGMTMPQAVMSSVYHEFTDHLALMANLGWQDWSQFGRVNVSVDADTTTSLTTDPDYKDTWHVALGAQYRAADAWLLTGGVAYDSAMDVARGPLSGKIRGSGPGLNL